jgi:hypothetical protein
MDTLSRTLWRPEEATTLLTSLVAEDAMCNYAPRVVLCLIAGIAWAVTCAAQAAVALATAFLESSRARRLSQAVSIAVLLASSSVSAGQAAVVTLGPLSTTPSAGGFTSDGIYNPVDIYRAGFGLGIAFLLPPIPIELPLGGVSGGLIDFGGNLQNAQGSYAGAAGGWSYTSAATSLAANSLNVTAYDVSGSSTGVGIASTATTLGIAVDYSGPAIANAHWIQVIADNHKLGAAHGTLDNKIDITAPDTTPYYDASFAANATTFLDAPTRSDATNTHWWLADLYYASGPLTPGAVTLYDGLLYGWGNFWFSGLDLAAFLASGNAAFLTIPNLSNALGINLNGVLNQAQLNDLAAELPTLEADFDAEVAANPGIAPEPASLLLLGSALLILGAISRGRLRR